MLGCVPLALVICRADVGTAWVPLALGRPE